MQTAERELEGGVILEDTLTLPVAVTAGKEYYLSDTGAILETADLSPLVMSPRAFGAVAGLSSPLSTIAPVDVVSGTAGAYAARCDLDANNVMVIYCGDGSVNTSAFMVATVFNKNTGAFVATANIAASSGADNGVNAILAVALVATNTVAVVTSHKLATNIFDWRRYVFTFNGTTTITPSVSPVGGHTSTASQQLKGQGRGSFANKVLVGGTGSADDRLINLADGTSSAIAFNASSPFFSEGQYSVRLATSNFLVLNTSTGSVTTLAAGISASLYSARLLWPTVYLLSTSSGYYIVKFNASYTTVASTLLSVAGLGPGFSSSTVITQVFTIGSGLFKVVVESSSLATGAFNVGVNSSGTVTVAPYNTTGTDERLILAAKLISSAAFGDAIVLSSHKVELINVYGSSPGSASYAVNYITFKAAAHLSQYKPKFIGRALETKAASVAAKFLLSPQTLKVLSDLALFTPAGRTIKVSDLYGYFLDTRDVASSLRVDSDSNLPASATSRSLGVTQTTMNYPVIFESLRGEVSFANTSAAQVRVFVVMPDSFWQATINTGTLSNLKLQFSGFAVVGFCTIGTDSTVRTVDASFNLEAMDYV